KMLKPLTPTSANRAAIWYPGEVEVTKAGGSASERTLTIRGRARNGAAFAEAAAMSLPAGFRVALEGSSLNVSGTVTKGKTYVFSKFLALARARWDAPVEA